MSKVVRSKPEVPKVVVPTGLEEMLRSYFTGLPSTGLGPRSRPLRKDWSDMKCFSCGKSCIGCVFSIYPAGMEDGEDTDWVFDGFT